MFWGKTPQLLLQGAHPKSHSSKFPAGGGRDGGKFWEESEIEGSRCEIPRDARAERVKPGSKNSGICCCAKKRFPAGSAPGNRCFYGTVLPDPAFVGIFVGMVNGSRGKVPTPPPNPSTGNSSGEYLLEAEKTPELFGPCSIH